MQDIPVTFRKAVCLSVQNEKAFYCPSNCVYLQSVEEQPGNAKHKNLKRKSLFNLKKKKKDNFL